MKTYTQQGRKPGWRILSLTLILAFLISMFLVSTMEAEDEDAPSLTVITVDDPLTETEKPVAPEEPEKEPALTIAGPRRIPSSIE